MTYNPEDVVLFWKTSSPFSQFHPCRFVVTFTNESDDNKDIDFTFTSAEQYMMYMKAVTFKDFDIADKILNETVPKKIKALGRKVKNFKNKKWNSVKFDIVKEGNIYKFSQNKDLKKALRDTGDKILVEASPYDRIWGIGMGRSNPDVYDPSKWKGQNLLGKALMDVREYLYPQ